MALRKKKPGDKVVEIPMSSMIDVVFLLLIYFVYTHREELAEAHLAVNLPSPNAAQTSEVKPRLLELEVHPGQVMLQGAPRPLDAIKTSLAHLASLDPDQTVMVKTSVLAKTEELVAVLDLCKAVGFTKLNVVTLQ